MIRKMLLILRISFPIFVLSLCCYAEAIAQKNASDSTYIELKSLNWEGHSSTIAITKDGHFKIEMSSFAIEKPEQTKEGKLSKADLKNLDELIEKADLTLLKSKYTGPKKISRSEHSYILIIDISGTFKTISFYSGDETVPKNLIELVNRIEELTIR